MRPRLLTLLFALLVTSFPVSAACCYFAALGKDVNQPGQKAFVTWDDQKHLEAFTVQPGFQGHADDFGMVIPTPSRPKLQVMPRDFFKALAIFTILEPMDLTKYKRPMPIYKSANRGGIPMPQAAPHVKVLEAGVVGSLEYKILEADRADALFQWLKDNRYTYGGDQATLDYYVAKKWTFTVMKIDPRQMKKAPDGSFTGDVTPTRFQFASDTLVYPLHITQISVPTSTDALFYVMARNKVDLLGRWSYQPQFLSMWQQALGYAIPEKVTTEEKTLRNRIAGLKLQPDADGATLEWAARLTAAQMGFITGDRKYDRDAPPEEVASLKVLRGHMQEGWYLTKFRKQFNRQEMTKDLEMGKAQIGGQDDNFEYTMILPTSPP